MGVLDCFCCELCGGVGSGLQIFIPPFFSNENKRRQEDVFSVLNTQIVSQSKNSTSNPPSLCLCFVHFPLNSTQFSFKLPFDAAEHLPHVPFNVSLIHRGVTAVMQQTPHHSTKPNTQQAISSVGAAEKPLCRGIPEKRKGKEAFFPVADEERRVTGWKSHQCSLTVRQQGLWFLSSKIRSAFLCRNASAVSHGSLVFLCSTLR